MKNKHRTGKSTELKVNYFRIPIFLPLAESIEEVREENFSDIRNENRDIIINTIEI